MRTALLQALDEAGVHALEARVGPVPKDRYAGDDRRRAFVLAEDPSLRVLVLAARVTRAVSIQPTAPTSSTSAGTDGCSVAAATISSSRRGIESTPSVHRMSTASTQPPT